MLIETLENLLTCKGDQEIGAIPKKPLGNLEEIFA